MTTQQDFFFFPNWKSNRLLLWTSVHCCSKGGLNDRLHSRFEFQIGHLKISTATLVTNQKWNLTCSHTSDQNYPGSPQKLGAISEK